MSEKYIKVYIIPPPENCSLTCNCDQCVAWVREYNTKISEPKD